MTKKDFELIAAIFRSLKPNDAKELRLWEQIVRQFTNKLTETNPNFQRLTFQRACGLE
jgi:hypothetical protein